MTRKETEAAVLDRAQREIREFAEATGSTTPLAHLARIVVGTLPFEAKVTAKLASTIEKTRITSEWSGASEEEALHDLQTYAKSIDETDQWLETHLGKSIAFETKRVRHRDCLEVCGSCSGSGRGTCPQCHGARKVNCTSWNCRGGKVPCDRFDCKDGYHPCGVCGGWCYIKKWVTEGHNESGPIKNLRSVQCSNCSGSGKGVACVNCRGSSWVTCSTCGGASRVTCDTCRGSGDVICGSCNGQGHLSHRLTLRLTVSTTRRYQSRARVEVERLCERSPDFQAQINSAPRWNLTYSSSGQTGHYFYEGSASYAELVVDDEPLLLAGHPDRPARATAALYAPVLQEFFPLIDRLDVTRLKTSRLGGAVVDVMMRGAKPKDSLLDRYDHENLLMPRIQGVMKDAIARINAGETLLRLRIILLASLVGALIYLVPFQHALAALGAEALIGSFSNISAWFWGSLVTLWATPFLAMRAFIYERRIRRAERSAQIFGEPRKEETGRDLKTFFAVLVGQTAIMFGTFFLPEPLYPQPCQAPVSDSKSACIAMGLTYSYIGLFLTLHRDFEANTGAAVEVPHLADFAKGVAVHRAYY